MATITPCPPIIAGRAGSAWEDPAYQGFWLLRIGFTVAPICSGWTSSSTRSSTGQVPGVGVHGCSTPRRAR